MSDFSAMLTGIVGDNASEGGLFDDGEQKAEKTDLLGNQLLPHKYALVARISSTADMDRIQASNFCQKFQTWIRDQELLSNYPTVPEGYQAFSISAANGRLTARSTDGTTALYEIPIEFKYWRFVNDGYNA
jgi:hypothetical protein